MKTLVLCAALLASCVSVKTAPPAAEPVAPIQSCQSQAEEFIAALPRSSKPIGDKQLNPDVYLLAISNDDQSVDVMIYVADGTSAADNAKKEPDFKFVGKCAVKERLIYIYKHHQVPEGA